MSGRTLGGRIAKRAVLIFLPLALGALCLTYLLYASQETAIRTVAQATEDQVLDVARQRVNLIVTSVMTDASYLSEQDALQNFLATGDPDYLRHIEMDYLTFAKHRQFFDQARFLDLTGREIVRVDRRAGEVGLVPPDQLQDKSDRYYTTETLKLGAGQAFVSPIDLNVEAGAIELPIKPTIRVGVPVFDGGGNKRGIVVINYLAQRVLDRVQDLGGAVAGIWLVNADGYWLLGPNAQDAFAFMYPDRKDQSFAAVYPEVWRQMQAAPGSGRMTQSIGEFGYARVDVSAETPMEAAAPPHWFLVIFTPNAYSTAQISTLRQASPWRLPCCFSSWQRFPLAWRGTRSNGRRASKSFGSAKRASGPSRRRPATQSYRPTVTERSATSIPAPNEFLAIPSRKWSGNL